MTGGGAVAGGGGIAGVKRPSRLARVHGGLQPNWLILAPGAIGFVAGFAWTILRSRQEPGVRS
jgi:hypothetical protein